MKQSAAAGGFANRVVAACVGLGLLGSCIQSGDTKCDWGEVYCPAGTVCYSPERQCVFPAQLTACRPFPDFRPCYFSGQTSASYWCQKGLCVPASSCGNGLTDEGEACDDGNSINGDGCTADCQSDEQCGNGYVDVATGEECDDGNLRSRDGCTSTCRLEVADWKPWRSPFTGGRSGHAMAYDESRNRVVLFGGWDGEEFLGDTWEYDGSGWIAMSTEKSPLPRYSAAMAYDSVRHVIVLFGGQNRYHLGDTWEYDGVSWTERPGAEGGPLRWNHAMAFDAARGRVVLYGGLTFDNGQSAWASDTREYDGVRWRDTSPATGPPALQNHGMVYDAARGNILLVGGYHPGVPDVEVSDETWIYDGVTWQLAPTGGTAPRPRYDSGITYDASRQRVVVFGGNNYEVPSILSDTWEYDGAQWIEVVTSTAPRRRGDHQLVYDAARNVTVAFGGYEAFALMLSDTWEYDGVGWKEVTPLAAPPPRGYFGMSYDTARRVTVLFGGSVDRNSSRDDTWEFDGRGWVETSPVVSPPSREESALVFDEARERTVLFGGRNWDTGLRLNDTWLYDGAHWTEVAPAQSPSPRVAHGMAYDPARERVVLFGGRGATVSGLDDTWEFDGTTWERREPVESPPGRFWHSMAYDGSRGRVVLFGGWEASGIVNDFWTYDGQTWEEVEYSPAPTERISATLAYDANAERLLLFGGIGVSTGSPFRLDVDTWQLTATGWSELDSSTNPEPREAHGMVYDRERRALLVFGGVDANTTLWEYRYRSADPDERCDNGVDDDADGLVDCDDPDCNLASGCPAVGPCGGTSDDPDAGCADHRCGGRRCAGADHICVAKHCVCAAGTWESDCGDGRDNDCDGQVDCDDADCLTDPYCSSGGECTVSVYMTCGDTVRSSNFAGEAKINDYACADYYLNAPEMFVQFTPRQTGRAKITLSNLDFDLDLVVLDTTPGGACVVDENGAVAETGCLGISQNVGIDRESVTLDVVAHHSYIIAVDGWEADTLSQFQLWASCD